MISFSTLSSRPKNRTETTIQHKDVNESMHKKMKIFSTIFFFIHLVFYVSYSQNIKDLLRKTTYESDMAIVVNKVNSESYYFAFRKLDTIIVQYPDYTAQTYEYRARIKLGIGDTVGALRDYDLCIEGKPREFSFYLKRGIIKLDQKKYSDALADFQSASFTASDLHPPLLYFYQGMTKVLVNDWEGGIVDLSFSIDSTEIQRQKNSYSEILKSFMPTDDENDLTLSNLADAYCFRGFALISLKQLGLGCADLRKAQALGHSFAQELLKKYCNN
jgi:hypothetical protein